MSSLARRVLHRKAGLAHPERVGIGIFNNAIAAPYNALDHLERVKPRYYQDYGPTILADSSSPVPDRTVQFIPRVKYADLGSSIPPGSPFCMTFNEPERALQDNISVVQAVAAWPQLEAFGVPLCSPACDKGVLTSGWFADFMAAAHGLRIDYTDIHIYQGSSGSKDPDVMKSYIDTAWSAYGKPVIISEWGLIDWANTSRFTVTQIMGFAKEAMWMMDEHPHVHSHYQFISNYYVANPNINTNWWDINGLATRMEQLYRDLLST